MNEASNESMGAIIARRRRELGLTQEQLAGELGISYQAVSKWENELSSPDISAIPLLADTLGLTIGELFGREAPKAAPEEPEPPKGPELPEGFEPPEGFDPPEGFEPPEGPEPPEAALVPAAPAEEPKAAELPWPDDGTLRAVLFIGRRLVGHEKLRGGVFGRQKISFQYEGSALNVHSAFDVTVDGDVRGSVTADGSVNCGAVGDAVTAGGSVNCDAVGGMVTAGGSVSCDDVGGDVHAGGGVTCDEVGGGVRAGGSVTCDDVTGDVQAAGDVTAERIGGDVRAEGGVRIGE